jgi:hypothetical protein
LAYLTLPCKKAIQDLSAEDSVDEYDYNCGFLNSTNICSIIDPASLTITEEQRRRFHKVMNFLSLRPMFHTIQVLNDSDKDGPILTKKQKTDGILKDGFTDRSFQVVHVKERLKARAKGEFMSPSLKPTSLAMHFRPWQFLREN